MSLPIIHNSLFVIRSRFLVVALAGLITIAIALTLVKNYETLQYITQTNITPFATTLTWTSPSRSPGCIIVFNLPTYLVCEKSPSFNHSLTLAGLRPDKTYRLLLISGTHYGFSTISHPFVPDQIPALPNVAYGKVVTKDSNTPIPGATIIVNTPRGPVSTTTGENGTYSLNLRDSTRIGTVFPVTINWQYYHLEDDVIVMGQHQPTPDFEILDQATLDQINQSDKPTGLSFIRI